MAGFMPFDASRMCGAGFMPCDVSRMCVCVCLLAPPGCVRGALLLLIAGIIPRDASRCFFALSRKIYLDTPSLRREFGVDLVPVAVALVA